MRRNSLTTQRQRKAVHHLGSSQDILILGLVLITVVAFILAWALPVWPGDAAWLAALQDWQNPVLTRIFRTLTYLGWYPVATALTLVVLAGLLWQRRRVDALLLTVVVLFTFTVLALKPIVGRPRPDYAIIEPVPPGLGFPSGHATFAILLGGILIWLTWQYVEEPWVRRGLAALLAVLILGVGISRVYLGVHWPSDVLGGYLYGLTGLLIAVRTRDLVVLHRQGKVT